METYVSVLEQYLEEGLILKTLEEYDKDKASKLFRRVCKN